MKIASKYVCNASKHTCVCVLHLLLFCCCSVHVIFWLYLTPAVFPSTQAARTLKSQLLATVHLPCILRGVATLPHRECQCSCVRSTAVVAERERESENPKRVREIKSESDSAWYPSVKAKAKTRVRERERELKRAILKERNWESASWERVLSEISHCELM